MKIPGMYRCALKKLASEKIIHDVSSVMKAADQQYGRFFHEIPDIGGRKNMQFNLLQFLVAFFSLYEACDRTLDIEDFDHYADMTIVRMSRMAGHFMNWNMPVMIKIAYRRYGRYKETVDRHVRCGEWGNTWQVDINPEGKEEGFAIHTRCCPMVEFVKRYGYEKFLPSICSQDFKAAEAMHGILSRTHTVADGDEYCDWWYVGDRKASYE